MRPSIGRRSFLQGVGALLALAIVGCSDVSQTPDGNELDLQAEQREQESSDSQLLEDGAEQQDGTEQQGDNEQREKNSMQITITVNGTPFTATIENTEAGQELLSRLPLTLSMEELHGNEKYCYTGEAFVGEQFVPETIEAGDLMVFGSDCVVLFYETFANGGWSYQRLGKIDDPTGLADACGTGTVTVEFASAAG